MIIGFDDDLAGEPTRVANRLHGLLTQIHPSLERVLGPRLQHPAVLRLLERFGSPAQIRRVGRRRLVTLLRPKAPRMAERLVEEIFAALDEQTVTVPGTDAAALIVPSLAARRDSTASAWGTGSTFSPSEYWHFQPYSTTSRAPTASPPPRHAGHARPAATPPSPGRRSASLHPQQISHPAMLPGSPTQRTLVSLDQKHRGTPWGLLCCPDESYALRTTLTVFWAFSALHPSARAV